MVLAHRSVGALSFVVFASTVMILLQSSAFILLFTLALFGVVHATLVKRQSISPLSSVQIASYSPFTNFASTAYCEPSTTLSWSCGANCNANPDFVPVASGGDGAEVQFWYVGFSPSQDTVIVAHQGTKNIEADLTYADFFLEPLDSSLFPGIPSSVEVHSGFASTQAQTATEILSAVKTTLSTHGVSSVTVVGHSLGAALSLLDGVYLGLHLSSSVNVRVVGYGMPRVGNQDFANWVDADRLDLTHINNQKDPVPILPGKFLGFHHASGEVHITDPSTWESCPGQDNPSELCTVGDVPNVFEGNLKDHDGPYNGITIGC